MDEREDDEPWAAVGARLPAWCTRWRVVVAPGAERAYAAAEWRDAVVVVEQGEILLIGRSGSRLLLGTGAVLVLDGVELRALRNPGAVPTVLVATARRAPCADL